jgi:hypothetical protein
MTNRVIDRNKLKPSFVLSAITAVLLLIASAGGLFVEGVYAPVVPKHIVPAVWGADLLSLLAVPVLAISLYRAMRGSLRGLITLTGVLGYVAYVYAFATFEAYYTVLFPVYVALLGLSVYTLVGILINMDGKAYRQHIGERMPTRLISLFFIAIDVLVLPAWLWAVVNAIAARGLPAGFNAVYVLDLALVLPAFLLGAVKLWRREGSGYILSGVLLAKAATLGLSIIFGHAFTYAHGFAIPWGRAGLFLVLTVVSIVLTIVYLKNLRKPVDIVYIDH